MTTKEAIALLQIRVDLIKRECPDIWNDWGEGEALEMAIEALNNQFANPGKKEASFACTHEDELISRKAAIDEADEWMDAYSADMFEDVRLGIQQVKRSLRKLPSAQPEPKWIPCSERLPEVVDVLCCDVRGEMCIAYPYADKESNTGYSAESDSVYMIDCIAWMPLPEPYRGGEQDE